jgi:ATP-dependent RNA helicase DDX27
VLVEEVRARHQFDPSLLRTVSVSDGSDNEQLGDSDSDSSTSNDDGMKLVLEDAPMDPVPTFEAMSLSPPLVTALHHLAFTTPTPIQSIAIPVGLTGRDICGAAETGSGKTAAFLIPCVERLLHRTSRVPGCRVLVLLPTRELALQCHSVLARLTRFCRRVTSLPLVGGEPLAEQRAALLSVRPDIIIATPGRLIDHLQNTSGFALDGVDVLILDEADRMLEAGFEDELQEIVSQCPRSRQTLLFSATMTDKVESLSRLSLNRPVRLFMDSPGMLAKNLEQHFCKVRVESDRLPALLSLAKEHEDAFKRIIVFIPTKELCHRLCIVWRMAGLPECVELHGGLDQETRNENLDSFRQGKASVLLATDVAARGLDIPQVTLVLNYALPPAFPQYCHRVGRTARAGRSGLALSLVLEPDRKLMRSIIKNTPSGSPRPRQRRPHSPLFRWFQKFLADTAADVEKVLEAEREEWELCKAEQELKRAEAILERQKSSAGGSSLKNGERKPEWFQKKGAKKADLPQSKVSKAGGAGGGKSKKPFKKSKK